MVLRILYAQQEERSFEIWNGIVIYLRAYNLEDLAWIVMASAVLKIHGAHLGL